MTHPAITTPPHAIKTTYLLQEAGLLPPFTVVDLYNLGTASQPCDFCGTAILWVYTIKSSCGHSSNICRNCVKKTGDTGLITEAASKRRERNKEIKRALLIAAQEQRLEDQRAENDGLTDFEMRIQKVEERDSFNEGLKVEIRSLLLPLADILSNASKRGGDFAQSVSVSLFMGSLPVGRGVGMALNVLALSEGKKGSTEYDLAKDRYSGIFKKAHDLMNRSI